jgi:hypothetical protein
MRTYAPYVLLTSSAVLGVGFPWLFVRMLGPALESGHLVTNYRGRPVHSGLGVAWLVWAGTAIVGGLGASLIEQRSSLLGVLMLAGPFALVACTMGMFDDAYGSGESRGFRGHLSALKEGRLTTGGLKLIGISAASLVVAFVIAPVCDWGSAELSAWAGPMLALAAGASMALTSNLVNLTDLRPGRASKVYLLLAAGGVFSAAWGLRGQLDFGAAEVVALALFVIGPVVATWAPDLGERGMLGDAGANAAGAVAGMLLVIGLPWWGLVAYLAAVLALNLLSERVSFSKVIEGNAILSAVDRLGRLNHDDAA